MGRDRGAVVGERDGRRGHGGGRHGRRCRDRRGRDRGRDRRGRGRRRRRGRDRRVGRDETPSAEYGTTEGSWDAEGQPTGEAHSNVEFPTGEVPEDFEVDREAAFAAIQAAAEAAASAEVATDAAARAEAVADIAIEIVGSHDEEDARVNSLGLTPDFDAAEAESGAGTDGEAVAEIGDDALAARLAGLTPGKGGKAQSADIKSTQIVVVGLVSVASIASFKRHLGRLAGVQSVGVSSGPDGEFLFAVNHAADTSLRDLIPGLPSFQARVTGSSDGILNVTGARPRVRQLGDQPTDPPGHPGTSRQEPAPWPDRPSSQPSRRPSRAPSSRSCGGGLRRDRRRPPGRAGGLARGPSRCRRRDPRRRERLRHLARVLRAPPRGRPADPGPDGPVAASARHVLPRPDAGRRRRRVLHPALLRRRAPLAGRGDVHPVDDDRRRLRPGHPGRLDELDEWQRRATVLAVFNPKGGVGKTTVATNLASALQLNQGQSVLLVDADTVTGHVTTSLGLEQVRTVADSWRDQLDGGPPRRSPRSPRPIRRAWRSSP